MIINDRQIVISAAGSRKGGYWTQQKLYWSELVERLVTTKCKALNLLLKLN